MFASHSIPQNPVKQVSEQVHNMNIFVQTQYVLSMYSVTLYPGLCPGYKYIPNTCLYNCCTYSVHTSTYCVHTVYILSTYLYVLSMYLVCTQYRVMPTAQWRSSPATCAVYFRVQPPCILGPVKQVSEQVHTMNLLVQIQYVLSMISVQLCHIQCQGQCTPN
jgi:hypothetical protein